jgi:hypothetical protein
MSVPTRKRIQVTMMMRCTPLTIQASTSFQVNPAMMLRSEAVMVASISGTRNPTRRTSPPRRMTRMGRKIIARAIPKLTVFLSFMPAFLMRMGEWTRAH